MTIKIQVAHRANNFSIIENTTKDLIKHAISTLPNRLSIEKVEWFMINVQYKNYKFCITSKDNDAIDRPCKTTLSKNILLLL